MSPAPYRRRPSPSPSSRPSPPRERAPRRTTYTTSRVDSRPRSPSPSTSRHYRSRRHEGTRSRSPRPPAHRRRHSPHSPHGRRPRQRSRSRSSSPRRRRHAASPSPIPPHQRSRRALPSQDESYRGADATDPSAVDKPAPKERPNFKATGLLAAETKKVTVGAGPDSQSIVLKYHEPPEARKPPAAEAWLMYIFKGASKDPLHTIQLHERSCWLLGRESAVADVLVEHPSCSKQHAVFQFRYVVKKNEWGEKVGRVGLYILDLESANGTKLNGKRLESARYVEIMSNDVVSFGSSEREYVILLPPKD